MPHPPLVNGYPLEPIKDASLEYLQAQLLGGGIITSREPLQRHSFDEGTLDAADDRDTQFVPLRHSLQSSERFRPAPGAAAAKAAMTRVPGTESERQNSGSVNLPAPSSRSFPTWGQTQGTGGLSFGQVQETLGPQGELGRAAMHGRSFADASISPKRRPRDGDQAPVASCASLQSLPPGGLSNDVPIASLTAATPCILRPAPPSPRAVGALLAVPLPESTAQAAQMTHEHVRRQSQAPFPGCPHVPVKVMHKSMSQEAFSSSSHQACSTGAGQCNTTSSVLQSSAARFEVPPLAQVLHQSVPASRQLSARRNSSASVPWSSPSMQRKDALVSGIAPGAPPPVAGRPRSPKRPIMHPPASRMHLACSQASSPAGAGGSVLLRMVSSPAAQARHCITTPQHPQHPQDLHNLPHPQHTQHPQPSGESHHSSHPHPASAPCEVSSDLPHQPAAAEANQSVIAASHGGNAGSTYENQGRHSLSEAMTDVALASTASTSASSASLCLTGTAEPAVKKAVIATFAPPEESIDSPTNSRAWWQVLAEGRAQRRDQRSCAAAAASNASVDDRSALAGWRASDSACIHEALGPCQEKIDPESTGRQQYLP
eukprot:TRINITY_DN6014_c0_g2_i1.p1 TRINITY_DN6014_c0_g2~~TRINITY_DN6014_c0_g2_i1.p1  ORF type:complete len:601 (+),score=91.61 TRINITY_DN6014_c0_g2_i1:148-1950(+)